MDRIKMTTPVVEMDGDEMTRILWQEIKDQLILPFVDLKTEYYDLGLPERDRTDDQVTRDAAAAIKKYGVGVKCATITPNAQRKEEYHLKRLLPSPNATLRAALDGTVFRAPISVKGVDPSVSCWKKPITIARHAYGDVYAAVEQRVEGPGLAEIVFTADDGTVTRKPIFRFEGPGILQAMHNLDRSIYSFARSCFRYALSEKLPLWFATKDTISKTYDHRFKDILTRSMRRSTRSSSRPPASPISTPSSMMRWPGSSAPRADSCWPARITTAISSAIWSPGPSGAWP